VECQQVNITSVVDASRRSRLLVRDRGFDEQRVASGLRRATSGSTVSLTFMVRVLLEEMGLRADNAATTIMTRLSDAQSSGQLAVKVNQVLAITVGSGNFSAITVGSVETVGDVVFEVLRTAAPTSQPSFYARNGDDDHTSEEANDLVFLYIVVAVSIACVIFGGAMVLRCYGKKKIRQTVHNQMVVG
jgi:hypothetical protein